jgi:hypothetical protein
MSITTSKTTPATASGWMIVHGDTGGTVPGVEAAGYANSMPSPAMHPQLLSSLSTKYRLKGRI